MSKTAEHPSDRRSVVRGAVFGLLAALLFGLSTPISKILVLRLGPLHLSAFLYLGAGLGVALFHALRGRLGVPPSTEAKLSRGDALPMAGVVFFGGVLGPITMMLGLRQLSGVAAALLLNLEAPATIFIALLLFREHLGKRAVLAAVLIIGGAALLAYAPGEITGELSGVSWIAAACACYGLDNNLTQRVSLKDPVAIVRLKALGAGACSLALATFFDPRDLAMADVSLALATGSVCYGASIVFDALALRFLGAAREAAFFATAPFAGAAASLLVLGEALEGIDLAAGALMALGVVVLLRDRHAHVHTHDELEHEHRHVHDEHHQHAHDGPFEESHSHRHRHEALTHDHPHVSDSHHRHTH